MTTTPSEPDACDICGNVPHEEWCPEAPKPFTRNEALFLSATIGLVSAALAGLSFADDRRRAGLAYACLSLFAGFLFVKEIER